MSEESHFDPAAHATVLHNISDAARAVAVHERPYKDHYGRDATEVVFHVPKTDFSVGMKGTPGKLVLLHIGSASGQHTRGGHGFATMQRAIKYAADHRRRFLVNEFVPPQLHPLMRKLVRHGYDLRVPTGLHVSPSMEIGTTDTSFRLPLERDWR